VADIVGVGAGVVWCPSSNLSLLGQTIAPHRLRALFDAGCLALGTDSRLTGARDLLAELQVAAAHSDFTPRELLQMVTARALRLLRAPERADYIILRETDADPFSALSGLQRAQLRAVIRDGEPVITDPDFADWFAQLRIPCSAVQLDGQPKLCRSDVLLNKGVPAWSFEPGLTLQ
jgi:cytosine/adenosine deaminase-related metal-dependent hydrolase